MDYKVSSFSLDIMDVVDTVKLKDSYKEYDNVILRVAITERQMPLALHGKTIRLFALKPNKEAVYQESNIVKSDADRGIVDITLTKAALTQIGEVIAEIEVINSDGSLMTTGNFSFNVVNKLNDLDTDEEVGESIEFLKDIQEFLTSTRPEEQARQQEEDKRETEEKKRQQEEAERKSAETTRIENEKKRDSTFEEIKEQLNVGITTSDIDAIISNALNQG